jgi:hypothetical protein
MLPVDLAKTGCTRAATLTTPRCSRPATLPASAKRPPGRSGTRVCAPFLTRKGRLADAARHRAINGFGSRFDLNEVIQGIAVWAME